MELSNIADRFEELSRDIRAYLQLRLEILKCSLTGILAKSGAILLQIFLFSLLAFFFLFFLALGFVFWFGDHVGPMYLGSLIVAGACLLVGILGFLLRKKLFLNPMVSVFSKIIFEADEEPREEK